MNIVLKVVLCLVILVVTLTAKSQTFSVSIDSVFTIRQTSSIVDTTGRLKLHNLTTNPLQLKIVKIFEDLSPSGMAIIEYDIQNMLSSDPIGIDSTIIQGNDSIDFVGIFFPPLLSSPENKVRLLVYDQNDSLNSHQILTFTAINCGPQSNQIIIDPLTQFCSGDSVFISANNNFSSYIWSNGDTSQTVHLLVDSVITVTANDSLGCISRDTLNLNVSVPFNESICIVSVDSATQKNIVVWEKTSFVKTQQTFIYKESFQAGVYNLIGAVQFDSLSVFIDNTSIPLQNSDRYKISTIDSCGNESTLSTEHKTIHLTASVGVGGENNLVWDGYEGFSFLTYNILRGSSSGNLSVIASVANTLFTFTDLTPPVGANFYRIEAVRNSACTPTQKATTFLSSVSNGVNLNPLSIDGLQKEQVINVYPNPTTSKVLIDLGTVYDNVKINVVNVMGTIVLTEVFNSTNKINVEINNKAGFYFVEIIIDNNIITKKMLVK